MRGREAHSSIERKNPFRIAILLYTFILLSGNFVGDHSLQIFYFTCSMGTLCIQLVFCGIIGFTETIGFRRTIKIVWSTALIHVTVALLLYYVLGFPIPEFWVKHDIDSIETWRQLNVILMLSIGYACSALAIVNCAGLLRTILGRGWLLLRISILIMTAFICDMLILMPILFFIAPDSYMAYWKMISLASVKISLSLIAIPICYFMIYALKNNAFLKTNYSA